MTIKLRFGLLLTLYISSFVFASDQPWQSIGSVTQVRKLPNGVELTAGKSAVRVVAVSDSVVRVRVAQNGSFPDDHSWAILLDSLPKPPTVKVVDSAKSVFFPSPVAPSELRSLPCVSNFLMKQESCFNPTRAPWRLAGVLFAYGRHAG